MSPGSVLVSPAGDLDLSGLPLFELTLRQAATFGPTVVVDLRRLDFIDHAGIQALVRADRRICEAGGRMVVVRGSAMVSWFFELSGVEDELEIVDRPPRGCHTPTRASDDDDVNAPTVVTPFVKG